MHGGAARKLHANWGDVARLCIMLWPFVPGIGLPRLQWAIFDMIFVFGFSCIVEEV